MACLTGCGNDAADFVGTWTFGTGSTVVISCPGQPTSTVPIQSTTLTITEVSSTRISSMDLTGCDLEYDVSGDTASLPANASCTVTGTLSGTQSFTSGTLTLNTATTMTAAASGSFLATGAPPAGACPLTLAGTLTKNQ
jgi:hypothetical protein